MYKDTGVSSEVITGHKEVSRDKVKKVFLATPIQFLLESGSAFNKPAEDGLKAILHSLRSEGKYEVFCAIERECWGAAIMPGEECTLLDYEGLVEADVVLAFPCHSYGVHIELGWASSLKKPIIACIGSKVGIKTSLVEGLSTITKAKIVNYDSDHYIPDPENWNKMFPAIHREIESLARDN